MNIDQLFELHRDATPATCVVDCDTFLQRIREHERTLEDPEQRAAWSGITGVTCTDGILNYITNANIAYTRAIGNTSDEVIANALATPMFTCTIMSSSIYQSVPVNKRQLNEGHRRLFGIFESFTVNDLTVYNSVDKANNEYVVLLSYYTMQFSSAVFRFACKVSCYARAAALDAGCGWTPKPNFLIRLQANSYDADFLHILAFTLFNINGTVKSEAALDLLENWSSGLRARVTEVMDNVQAEHLAILVTAVREMVLPKVQETLAGIPQFAVLTPAQQNFVLHHLMQETMKVAVITPVTLRAVRGEMTLDEYVLARNAEHIDQNNDTFTVEHTKEYACIQKAMS